MPDVVQALDGDNGFLSAQRLKDYNAMRNDPCSPKAVSTLSAYLHFGHISGQRVALEAQKHRSKYKVRLSYLALCCVGDVCAVLLYSCRGSHDNTGSCQAQVLLSRPGF